jgi:PAS domain S-box-containing protein
MTRAGVETAIDGVITLDESATILSFNPAAERIYGVASAEMIGQSFADLDVPTDGDHAGELARYLCTGAREGRGRGRTARRFPAISM